MKYLFLFLLVFNLSVFGQTYAPKNIAYESLDLGAPMDIPLILAGNFGEMRSNHFHTGLDIKTQGVEGHKIKSIADGYISRIRVSPWGYGNAIYINHLNGLTSVYAHLSTFPAKIDSLFRKKHMEKEAYVLDEIVLDDSIFVRKGELIAFSGNSGSSSAPHLHFEIRETATEHALNPLLFKVYRDAISDKIKPKISGLKIYAIDSNGYMIPNKAIYLTAKKEGNNYTVNNDQAIDLNSIITEHSQLAFGIHTTDKLDGAHNVCGVHHTVVQKENHVHHEQKIDYIDFAANRYMNSHKDYIENKQNRRNIHKQFTTLLNPLPIYIKNNGKFDWQSCGGTYTFDVYDIHKNKSVLHVKIAAPNPEVASKNPFESNNYYFPHDVNTLIKENLQVLLEPGTFYEPLQKIYREDTQSTYLSAIYQFGEYSIPVQEKYDLRIKTPILPKDFPVHKLGIGLINDRGNLSFLGGSFIDGWVEAHPKNFGHFVLTIDTIPPTIQPLDFKNEKVITKYNTLELSIKDDLAGIMEYKAYLNGKWVLMIHNRRKKRFIIPLDKYSKPILEKGKNKIRISAVDYKGNKTEKSYVLIY